MKKISDLVTIDNSLAVPIYKQIVQSVCNAIESGALIRNDRLPSVNSIAEKFSLARGSVFSAYNELRASGIIDSIPGKGYFVTSTQTKLSQTIFLLFSRFDAWSALVYNSILKHLPTGSKLDAFFHNHNHVDFETRIREESAYYNTYIIVPEIYPATLSVLSILDQNQVILLDAGYKELRKHFTGVYSNIEKQLYKILADHKQLVLKYKRMFLVVPENRPARDVVAGFKKFGKTISMPAEITNKIEVGKIRKGDAYVVFDDSHLVELVACVKSKNWRPGKDIGMLSLNECELKSIIGEGISTFSSDYAAMGRTVAEMVATNDRRVVENPFVFTDRNSF